MNQSERVCAAVVTFNPDLTVLGRALTRIKRQVDAVVVIDNGSDRNTIDWLLAWESERRGQGARVVVIQFPDNRGVAAAQNAGIRWAKRHACTHVLILDHDSVPASDMVPSLLIAMRKLGNGRLAGVGAGYFDPRLNSEPHFVSLGSLTFRRISATKSTDRDPVPVDFLISSGALIPLATLEDVGLMDERLFVDYVDIEWFLRAKSLGYQAFGVFAARMEHRMGTSRRRIWLGKWRYVPSYSPSRFYYIMRNGMLLYKRHYTPWRWVVNDITKNFAIFAIFAVFVPPRLEHIRAMTRGLWDGLRSRDGKLGYRG